MTRMRKVLRSAVATAGVLVLGLTGMAGAGEEPELVAGEQIMYQRNGGSCGSSAWYFLSAEAGSSDVGCGYIYGLPLNTVWQLSGGSYSNAFPTLDGNGVPVILDASREVTGVVAVRQGHVEGNRIGAGQILVEVALRGRSAGGQEVELGTTTEERLADVTSEFEDVEYAFSLPADVDRVQFTSFELEVSIRGIHAMHGYAHYRGKSFVTLPTLVELDADREDV